MAAVPAIGLAHVTVVPTNFAPDADEGTAPDGDA